MAPAYATFAAFAAVYAVNASRARATRASVGKVGAGERKPNRNGDPPAAGVAAPKKGVVLPSNGCAGDTTLPGGVERGSAAT